MLGATALGAGALIGLDQAAASAAPPSAIVNASALYVDFTSGQARRFGQTASLTGAAYGDGVIRAQGTNLLRGILPFAGMSVAANRLPDGLVWQGVTAPKRLIGASRDGIGFGGRTTAASPDSFGGIRTSFDVVSPGQTVLLGFRPGITSLNGDPNASITACLIRISDQRATTPVRAHNAQEPNDLRSIIRLKAPPGGTGGYQLVISTQAGAATVGQSANFYLSQLVVLNEPMAHPIIGSRYTMPDYFAETSTARNLLLAPRAEAGTYYLVIRTDEFGWGAESVQLSGTSAAVDFKAVFGIPANMTVRELYVIAQDKWQKGWMDVLSPTTTWTSARYMNIDGLFSKSRPASPSILSRMSGMPAALSAIASDPGRNLPTLGAPDAPNAVTFNPDRLSHQAFEADKTHYIGDGATSAGIHSELWPAESVAYDRDEWISFWTRTDTPILDPPGNGEATIFQYRYINNATGDSSTLAPDLSLAQLTGNRFQLRYRTDHGTPVLTGSGEATGVTTVALTPVNYSPGDWHAVVVRVRFSKSGGGYLGFWFDGQKIFDQAAAVGYNRNIGPRLHYGTYKYSNYRNRTEFQHMEHGSRSLASRITSPLPV
jgi:hypothetical protein